jgi:hypothetical protein
LILVNNRKLSVWIAEEIAKRSSGERKEMVMRMMPRKSRSKAILVENINFSMRNL